MPSDELDTPIEAGHADADTEAKLDGLVQQIRVDVQLGNADDAATELRARLAESTITLTDDEFDEVLGRIVD